MLVDQEDANFERWRLAPVYHFNTKYDQQEEVGGWRRSCGTGPHLSSKADRIDC
jgi:hypothetical protein